MNNYIDIRNELLNEAKLSPNLLIDLAGLEIYISESYQSRSLMELVQNADDAGSTQFIFKSKKNYIICANNGRNIDGNDILALCRSAASKKQRGETIGYRGIGFKSVVAFCKRVSIISGECSLTFSREKTQNEIQTTDRVPLIRIPHSLSLHNDEVLNEVSTLKEKGYSTFFIFEEIINNETNEEIINFPISSLLFLHHIQDIELDHINETRIIKAKRDEFKDKKTITIEEKNQKLTWIKITEDLISIAIPTNTKETKGMIHVFLPTEDETGFNCIFNGDFTTDPARRHIIFDEKSENCIQSLAKVYLKSLLYYLKQENSDIANALSPTLDSSIVMLQNKGFIGKFFSCCKLFSEAYANEYKLIPSWLKSSKDEITKIYSKNHEVLNLHENEKLKSFLKYLGIKDISLIDLTQKITPENVSYYTIVQICTKCIKNLISPDPIKVLKGSEKVFISDQGASSLDELKKGMSLKLSFMEDLLAEGLTESELNDFQNRILANNKNQNFIFQATQNTSKAPLNQSFTPNKRWRATELLVLDALNAAGYTLFDVSKSNLGYDLEGISPTGRKVYIEVKSITIPGEKFRLTNNEVALSRELGNDYILAIALTSEKSINIHLTNSPLDTMKVNRQCTQWVWEVEAYDFNPVVYEFN